MAAGELLDAVPERIGDWEMRSSKPFDNETVQMLQCAGHFSRVYENTSTGETVTVAMLVGPTGPTAVHTPEICYSSRGQTIVESPTAVATRPETDPDESLWQMAFRSNDVEQNQFRVMYGWTGPEGHWRAASNPRFEHGGEAMLYKIQLAGPVAQRADKDGADPCQRFLRDFLPAPDATLFQVRSQ